MMIPPHRQLLGELLSDASYTAVLWPGVDDPVQFVGQTAPDLVILDLHLGDRFQAWDVIVALCGDESVVQRPVIICSADAQLLRGQGPMFRDHGCVIVEKPFDIDELLTTICQQLLASPPPDGGRDQATGSG